MKSGPAFVQESPRSKRVRLLTVLMSVVVVSMRFLMATREGITGRRCVDNILRGQVVHEVCCPEFPSAGPLKPLFAGHTGFLVPV